MNSFYLFVGNIAGAACAALALWYGHTISIAIFFYWVGGLLGVVATAALVLFREYMYEKTRTKQ